MTKPAGVFLQIIAALLIFYWLIIGMAAGQWIPGVLGVALLYIGGIPARRKS